MTKARNAKWEFNQMGELAKEKVEIKYCNQPMTMPNPFVLVNGQ